MIHSRTGNQDDGDSIGSVEKGIYTLMSLTAVQTSEYGRVKVVPTVNNYSGARVSVAIHSAAVQRGMLTIM